MRTDTAWLVRPALFLDSLTGEPITKLGQFYPGPVPIHPDQCLGCEWNRRGHINHDGEWYCETHYREVTTHPDEWQAYPMEYDEERW